MLKLLILILFFLSNIFSAIGEDTNLSEMSPKELLEFYKKNPDYGKNKIGIDYEKYKQGDYVVLRGEFLDENNNGIPNIPIKFNVNGNNYIYTTSNKGIFNLEIKKEEIKENSNYRIKMNLDQYNISFSTRGKNLIENSIYHFKINRKKENGINTLSLTNIKNKSFQEGEAGFTFENNIKEKPSLLGIQGIALIGFIIIFVFFTSFIFFKDKFIKSRENYLNRYKKRKKKNNNITKNNVVDNDIINNEIYSIENIKINSEKKNLEKLKIPDNFKKIDS